MKLRKIFAGIAAVSLLLLSGCNGNNTSGADKGSKQSSANAAVSSESPSEKESSVQRSEKASAQSSVPENTEPLQSSQESSKIDFSGEQVRPYKTLEEFLSSDTAIKIIEQITADPGEGVSEKKVYREGENLLVIETVINVELEEKGMEEFKNRIEESVNKDSKVFYDLVFDLEACIDSNDLALAVRYKNENGELLFEKIFDNNVEIS